MNDADQRNYLNEYSASNSASYVKEYKNLGDYLLVKYLDGNRKKTAEDGSFLRTPEGMPQSPDFTGYDERYYRSIVTDPEGGERLKVIEISK